MESRQRPLVSSAVLVIYAVALSTASHWPISKLPAEVPRFADKAIHFIAFGVLAGIGHWHLTTKNSAMRFGYRSSSSVESIVLLWVLVYSAVDEYTQPWFGRERDLWDWCADLLGAATAVLVCRIARKTVRN